MTVPILTVSPAGAAQAYARVVDGAAGASGEGFGAVLGRALEGVVEAGHMADARAMQALTGQGSLTDVATALSRADLALQGAVAIRDKVVSAYQDVMRMPI